MRLCRKESLSNYICVSEYILYKLIKLSKNVLVHGIILRNNQIIKSIVQV